MKKHLILVLLALLPTLSLAQVFQVEDIRIEGLQRVSSGSVFSVIPIRVGELVDDVLIQDSVRALFSTNFFDDIGIGRDGNVLVVRVSERPAISEIKLEGNKAINDDALFGSLTENGLSEGQIFKPATLDSITKALSREYVGQGLYGSSIDTKVRELPRNRVGIDITIDEGSKAKIRSIQVIGNEQFSDKEILSQFESSTGGLFSFITGSNRYAREKLSGDLERLESYYLDRGYVQFSVDSTQVSVSDNKESVYITVNITEGDVFTVNEVGLLGDLIINEQVLRRLVSGQEGATFSQETVTLIKEAISVRLGNEGYTFAEINEIIDVDEDSKTVDLTYFIDPKKRVYVRRVEFRGNTRTEDAVLRREMRQLESAIASNQLIENGKIRLDRLGFFSQVNSETVPVAGTSDQIDVIYSVEETNSGSISASIGFAQTTGAILGLSLQENNFLGSGNSVGIGINRSTFQESANLSFSNPYYTPDGVSAGFSVFARRSDFSQFSVASFTTDTYGATLNFGYPLTEVSRINMGFGYERLDIGVGVQPSDEIREFVGNNDGAQFNQWKIQSGWVRSTLNRGIFATRGSRQQFNLEVAIPGSDAPFYKASLEAQKFVPVHGPFALKFSTEIGYGDSFESNKRLPFFENYFGGGFGSVRGFEINTLGPRETPFTLIDEDGNTSFVNNRDADPRTRDPIGGNVLITGRAELLVPLPFLQNNRSVQSSIFFDAGNVFDTNCGAGQIFCHAPSLSELRYSGGFAVTWLSGFGPLSFSLSKAANFEEGEEQQLFQFSLGQTF